MSGKTTEFGKLCKSHRALLGLNGAQFGKKIGISQPTVSRFENGVESLPFQYIMDFINAYKISDKSKQMEFFLRCLESSEKLQIPLNKLNPLMKECLAALFTLGDMKENDPQGKESFIAWLDRFKVKVRGFTFV
jgi:transcriptional regulator with XRE-family HTH domain